MCTCLSEKQIKKRLVLDTNVLVSALITNGKPKELLLRAASGEFQLVLSVEILREFVAVIDDAKIRKYVAEEEIIEFLEVLGIIGQIVKVKSRTKIVEEDPSDDVVLNTAYDGKCDYVVSGDNDLLRIEESRMIKIVTARRMLELLGRAKE